MKTKYIALIIFLVTLAVYFIFCQKTYQQMAYFVPLASSILHGRLDVAQTAAMNELVPYAGKWFVVYAPFPAIADLPFVAIFGAAFNQVWASILYASAAAAFFFILTTRFTKKLWISLALTILLGFGTNFFYTSLIGSSWYIGHVLAVLFLVLALLMAKDKRPFWAGLFLGFAFLSREPVIFAFPALLYLILQGSKKDWLKKTILFFVALGFGVIGFALWNHLRFGSIFETGYSMIPGVLSEPWYWDGIFSIHYILSNLKAMFWTFPQISSSFPYFLPSNYAMAMWINIPALLLLAFVKFKDKGLFWYCLSAFLIGLPYLLHGCVGFTQLGYRFAIDYLVLLLLPLIYVFERIGQRWTWLFVGLSVAINLWVVILYYLGVFHT